MVLDMTNNRKPQMDWFYDFKSISSHVERYGFNIVEWTIDDNNYPWEKNRFMPFLRALVRNKWKLLQNSWQYEFLIGVGT